MRTFVFTLLCLFCLSGCVETPYFPEFMSDYGLGASAVSGSDDLADDLPQDVIEVVDSEDLLDADGNWQVVEQGRSLDPAMAHMAARKNVDIGRRKPMKDLTAHFEPDAKSGQDGTLRVLRIEADESDAGLGDIDVAQIEPRIKTSEVSRVPPQRSVFAGLKSMFKPQKYEDTKRVESQEHIAPAEVIDVSNALVPPALPHFRKPSLMQVDNVIVPARKPVRARVISVASTVVPKKKPAQRRVRVFEKEHTDSVSRALYLRSGRHPGKTRLVLEVSSITKYKVAIDPIRNVLRIKMLDTRWAMKPQGTLRGSRMLGSYIAREQKDGDVLLEVRLNAKTKILGTMVLPPTDSAKYRVVIDLED